MVASVLDTARTSHSSYLHEVLAAPTMQCSSGSASVHAIISKNICLSVAIECVHIWQCYAVPNINYDSTIQLLWNGVDHLTFRCVRASTARAMHG